jgi:hypothetical protein
LSWDFLILGFSFGSLLCELGETCE